MDIGILRVTFDTQFRIQEPQLGSSGKSKTQRERHREKRVEEKVEKESKDTNRQIKKNNKLMCLIKKKY